MFPNLKKWAFFYLSPNFSPESNTVRHSNDANTCIFISVGFSPSAKEDGSVLKAAVELVQEGVQTIELCGGFGPEWVARISEAIGSEIPIGSVMYGPEYRATLLEVMKP